MDDTPSSRYDPIRCRKISADTILIRFAYLIAYFVSVTTTMAATAEQNWRRDTAATGAVRERRESAQWGGSRGGTEKDRSGREGGHDELFYAVGTPLPHRRSCYRKLRALTALRPHVLIRVTAPCTRRTSGLISRRHAGLRRPPPAAPWHTTTSSARYKVSKRGW